MGPKVFQDSSFQILPTMNSAFLGKLVFKNLTFTSDPGNNLLQLPLITVQPIQILPEKVEKCYTKE